MFLDLQMGIKKWIDRWLMINCFCYNSKKDILLWLFVHMKGRRSKEGVGRAMQNLFHIFHMGSTFFKKYEDSSNANPHTEKTNKKFRFLLVGPKLREIWALKDLPSSSYIFCTFSPFLRLHCFFWPPSQSTFTVKLLRLLSQISKLASLKFWSLELFTVHHCWPVWCWSDAKNLREIGIFCK